jgi:hypothetical protein
MKNKKKEMLTFIVYKIKKYLIKEFNLLELPRNKSISKQ